jgi:hypothetical protein
MTVELLEWKLTESRLHRGLDTSLLTSPKLVFIEGEASRKLLGLDAALYEEV